MNYDELPITDDIRVPTWEQLMLNAIVVKLEQIEEFMMSRIAQLEEENRRLRDMIGLK